MPRASWSVVVVAALALCPRVALADGLRAEELSSLERGNTVARPLTVEQNGQRYVGGVTYTIVEATPDELLGMLDDVEAYRAVLPRTKYAERIFTRSADLFIELHHGNAVVDGTYTLMIHGDPANTTWRSRPTPRAPARDSPRPPGTASTP